MRFLALVIALVAAFGPDHAFAARGPADPAQWLAPAVRFSGEDRQRVDSWFKRYAGFVTRTYDPDGKLPRNLDRTLAPTDRLPPGVRKAPLPWPLESQLSPVPAGVERAIVGRHLVMLDARNARVLDIIRDVVR
jgi:hypothetical protein